MAMPKWDWFDDFMIMKMMEEDEAKKAKAGEIGGFEPVLLTAEEADVLDESEEEYESADLLEALQEELSSLQDELFDLECNEPDDFSSEDYADWEERRDLLESKIFDIEVAIQGLG